VEVLLERWQALVEFREIWGPANVASLAEALATIAGAPIAPPPPRLLLLEALGRQEGSLHVASLISLVAARLEEDPELEPFFSQFAIRLLELSREESIVEDPEDLEQVLGASARLLRRQELHDEAGRDLREELLATLLAGLRDRVPGVLGQLQRLREDEALPEAMRQTITRRLEALSR
jgi:hypothetical protein